MKTTLPDPHRAGLLRRTILERLENAEPHPLPESTLYVECRVALHPELPQAEFDDAIAWLQGQRYINSQPHPLDPDKTLWLITTTGKAALLK